MSTVAASPFPAPPSPTFDAEFCRQLESLFRWRRDVRRFRAEPLPHQLLDRLIELAALAPSVGNSQPWRFVKVDEPGRRQAIRDNFARCNAEALSAYGGERARLYASLKLSGLERAPAHLAVFVDTSTDLGHGLGRKTMPETLAFSVVGAVHALWLAARAHGVGMGWVSIIDPADVRATLDVPEAWRLVAYLCIGYAEEDHTDPELERHGWQARLDAGRFIVQR